MQDKVFYYANGDLLNGKSTSLIPTGVLNVAFKIYDVLPGDTSDWVMTSNGVYQRSGLNFTLMSGTTFGTFNGMISNSPLINVVGRYRDWETAKYRSLESKSAFKVRDPSLIAPASANPANVLLTPPNTASKDQPYRVKASNTDFLLLSIAAGCL